MAMSRYLRRAFLNHLLRTATLTKLDFLYWALYTEDPGVDNSGAEVDDAGTGYARQPVAVEDASWSAPADAGGYMVTHNLLSATWATPTGNQGTPSHWGLLDQVTGGNLWYYGAIQGTLRAIDVGTDPVNLPVSSVNIYAGQAASDYLETAILNHTLRSDTFAKPANVYAGLHDISPGDDDVAGEFTGVNYSRVAIAVADLSWSAPFTDGDSEKVTNLGNILWASPGSDWGTDNYTSLHDAVSGGNLLIYSVNDEPSLIVTDDNPPIIVPGGYEVSFS